HQSLFKINKYNKNIDLAPLFYARIHDGFDYLKKMGCKYIHTYYKVLDKNCIKYFHNKGIKINTFTVNKKIDILKMKRIAVDGIISDNLETVLNTVKNININD
ncbi:MAG: hypothetical protein K9K32_03375, partial [Halanaerobiales bacterium]|nr:hypothetical protein [Halanaerobiales bacterium]